MSRHPDPRQPGDDPSARDSHSSEPPGDRKPDPEFGGLLRAPFARSNRAVARRLVQPLQGFLDTEAAGGVLLLSATVAALAWANSPWGGTYETFWHTPASLAIGSFSLEGDLREWVDEGLMAIFFFVVGLEIKREVTTGELRDPKTVALPVIAAIGGMVVPALLYLAVVGGGEEAGGWAIPMATDIAFAIGVVTLAARFAPPNLKLFLLTLAIVDDIGAILVIAVFYSDALDPGWLFGAFALLGVMIAVQRVHVRPMAVYVALGVGVWTCVVQAGVSGTIAGVVMGLLAPAVPFQRPAAVSREARRIANETVDKPDPPDAEAAEWLELAQLSREAVSPLARLERTLHPWTSYLIVPLFALANAGVALSWTSLRSALTGGVALGVVVGLVVGKTIGISAFAWFAARWGLGRLPEGVTWRALVAGAIVAGIGFTVSLLIAGLAFEGSLFRQAKVGILVGSLVAGILGYLLLRAARGNAAREP